LRQFFAYDPSFGDGVRTAAVDVNADGFADVVTSAGTGPAANVHAFSGVDGSSLDQFFAGNPLFGAALFDGGS
jgi:hypothetical protein